MCEKDWVILKMVYEKFGRKSFSKNLHHIFWSTENIFNLTNILQVNKHSQMLKMFFEKYFTMKQIEPTLGQIA